MIADVFSKIFYSLLSPSNTTMNEFSAAIKNGNKTFFGYIFNCFRLSNFFLSILGDVSKISSLIQEGINVNQRFENGETPLTVAANQGKVSLKSNHF